MKYYDDMNYLKFFTSALPETIALSIKTEGSVYNTVWFLGVLFCYAVHGVHVIWTFVYKVQIIPEIKGYQTMTVPPRMKKPQSEERGLGFKEPNKIN